MNSNQEEDEFVAVRVQDPRVQNEGSWNSYVDYKIFLHTNSKAFTAKTSCVRRRYSEFAWLRKKLQKNAGLVPVPELPGKSFFSFSNEDFLEGRRKGLQTFLDKVVHMTVCLSDSQLHLFLQTQLPVGHIEDCVQGHTPYSVMDAILTYASSNWGLAQAQAQEDDSIKEPSLTVSYESMESPAPHQPCLQPKETFSPELLSCGDSDALELHDKEAARREERPPAVRISQNGGHLEAVVECDCGPAEVAFFLGDGQERREGAERRSGRMQTPVEVHSPMGPSLEEEEEESVATSSLDSEDKDAEGRVTGGDAGSQQEVLEVDRPEERDSGKREESCESAGEGVEATLEPETLAGSDAGSEGVERVPEPESHSLPSSSSNESIVQVSDEESERDEDAGRAANGFLRLNGRPAGSEEEEEEELRYASSLDLVSPVAGGDLSGSGDFSVLETSGAPDAAEGKRSETQETLPSLAPDAPEDARQVQVR